MNRAIYVFTAITIIFAPLGFITVGARCKPFYGYNLV